MRQNRSSNDIAAALAPFDIALKDYTRWKKQGAHGLRNHIRYLERSISEYQGLITRIRTTNPGDLFLWNCPVRMSVARTEALPVLFRFDYIDSSQKICITVLACSKAAVWKLRGYRFSKSPDRLPQASIELNDLKDCTPISIKNLPLYLNLEVRYPIFEQILKGSQ